MGIVVICTCLGKFKGVVELLVWIFGQFKLMLGLSLAMPANFDYQFESLIILGGYIKQLLALLTY